MRLGIYFAILTTAAHASARPLLVHAAARAATAKPNACQVLTRADLAAVQGEAYVDTQLTPRGETSQCFYELPTFVKSVSVDVTRRGGRQFFRENFHVESEREREMRERAAKAHGSDDLEAEPDAKKVEPKRIRGIGDDAYWAGSRIAGQLFVRKGDAYVRVSPGGAGTEAEKIERAKELAKRALRRL
ncbi:MAG: hypothetical protein JO197_13575 [Acidobacteria bacterium]|nr:hypothetical protein [Acidobacteriota bacterium]MBV9477726.1 hypothetical protein [Acidobacteriota bacterium]